MGVAFAILNRRAAEIRIARATGLTSADGAVIQRGTIGSVAANVRHGARIDALVIETSFVGGTIAVMIALEASALSFRITGTLSGASALSDVIFRDAIGVYAANGWHVAGISARIFDARGRGRTVGICETIAGLFASELEGIADQTVRTAAAIRAFGVVARGGRVTRMGKTFVQVEANLSGENEAGVAFADSSVSDNDAVSVSAMKPIAGTRAFVSFGVAVFVVRAVAVREALDLETTGRISDVAGLALTSGDVIDH